MEIDKLSRDGPTWALRLDIVMAHLKILEETRVNYTSVSDSLKREVAEELRKLAYAVGDEKWPSSSDYPMMLRRAAKELLPWYRRFMSEHGHFVEHQVATNMSRFFSLMDLR